jgi:hypothetical protein
MFAIVGIPGSQHHSYKWFARADKRAAEEWLDATFRQALDENPVLGSLPQQLISDRDASTVYYRDGRHVYSRDQSEEWEARFDGAEEAERQFWQAVADEARSESTTHGQ